ncbi:unnamed protein product [Rotaria sp. Silwood2]|nr:unnamed protein product [Rotaria sp. Silwood2]CAF2911419.1 unnamed protein product [Rotaria sp. Silwood2]CAF3312337.1 unnamed protein product [Rotaria sp. Silwood2]CAF3919815.1 unnamed protein product [Rotaria sp. Silwood2]CAF4287698.1 unnamed protein product [Rotaria sp. Silwood2]
MPYTCSLCCRITKIYRHLLTIIASVDAEEKLKQGYEDIHGVSLSRIILNEKVHRECYAKCHHSTDTLCLNTSSFSTNTTEKLLLLCSSSSPQARRETIDLISHDNNRYSELLESTTPCSGADAADLEENSVIAADIIDPTSSPTAKSPFVRQSRQEKSAGTKTQSSTVNIEIDFHEFIEITDGDELSPTSFEDLDPRLHNNNTVLTFSYVS